MRNSTTTAALLATAVTIILAMSTTSAAWAASPEKNIFGLSPEVASQLPGVPHLFQIRNASAPPQIAPGEKFSSARSSPGSRSR